MAKDRREKRFRRKLSPRDIAVPAGYKIEAYVKDLTTPINITFNEAGEMLIADAGITSGSGKLYKLTSKGLKLIAEGFNPPLTGITSRDDTVYVSHRGFITAVKPDGSKVNILGGLPSWGDHHNNKVVFSSDGKMYFGQGTATNSGVVGVDNEEWVREYPFFHDYPGVNINLIGQNFESFNFLTSAPYDESLTGAYSPFNEPVSRGEMVPGVVRASGSILRANPDGSQLELVAWGLRNPFRIKFDCNERLYAANHGMDVRGSRPVANSPDEFQRIEPGVWYGWPDFTGGLPVTLPQFRAEERPRPEFLFAQHPMDPPKPFTTFEPNSDIMGFDFNYSHQFMEHWGDAFVAEFGSTALETTGHRVSRIDMETGVIVPFIINKSCFPASYNAGGGLERPIDVVFGPDGSMYIADFGMETLPIEGQEAEFIPGTGVIWRVSKKD